MAAGANIKGITIEIGGDTTSLDKALKGANESTKTLQNQLKSLNQALKLDPKNTELLAQKQKLLGETISATKEKLETLKTAQEQAQAAFERGEISENQYRALQTEIQNTENELKRLEQQAKEMGPSLDKLGKKFQDAGKKIEGAGKKLLPVTAAITAVAGASVKAAMEIDEGYDTIIEKSGATGEELEDLKEQMDDVFADLPVDAEQAGTAIGEVNTRFKATGDELEEISKQFLRFSEVNHTDLTASIDSVDSIMKKFGVDAADTGKVLGLMTQAGQDTGITMDDLERSLETNGATLKEMGLGLEESVNLLAQFESSGVDSSTALAALKKAQQNAVKEGKTMDQVLTSEISSIKNASSETEALQIATELFGKKGAAEMTQAIREGRFSIDDLSASLEDYANTVEDTYNATLSPWDQMKVAMNSLKLSGAELGKTILETVQPMIIKLTEKVKQFTEWFKNLDEGQKKMIIKIGAVVAALGPALIIIGKITSGVGSIIKTAGTVISVLGKLGPAITTVTKVVSVLGSGVVSVVSKVISFIPTLLTGIKAVGAAMLANPIGIVIAAIAALVAAFIYLYNNCEEFRDAVNAIWASIKEAFFKAWDAIKKFFTETLPNAFNTVVDFVKNNWQGLLLFIVNPFAGAFKLIYDNCETFRNFIDNFVQKIKDFFKNLWDGIVTTFQNVGQWFSDRFTEAQAAIVNAFKNIGQWFADRWQDIKNALSTVAVWFRTMFQNAWKNIVNVFKEIGHWFANRWEDIKNALSSVAEWFRSIFQKAWDNIVNIFKNIGQWFSARWTDIKNVFKDTASWFKSAFQSGLDSIKDVFKDIGGWFQTNVIDAVKKKFEDFSLLEAGKKILNSLIEGIKSIHLPKLNLTWGEASKEIAGVKITVPVPKIEWNALGGIMRNPTLFGMLGGKLQGGGEAGDEAILPLDIFYKRTESYIDDAIARATAAAQGQQSGGRGGNFVQNIKIESPEPLTPYEVARQTRNATRNMVLQLQGGT